MRKFGKVLRFDGIGGFCIITPDEGGDHFLAPSDELRGDTYLYLPGTSVSFEARHHHAQSYAADVSLRDSGTGPVLRPVPLPSMNAPCDVLFAQEFRQEITDALIAAAPSLTAGQIADLRVHLVQFAKSHNWIVG